MAGAKQIAAGLLRWESSGKPPILALHGFTGDAEDYTWLAKNSSNALDWWAVDLPGHGLATVADPEGLTLEDFLSVISDARQRINDATGKAPILLGYSMGGRIALHAVRRQSADWRALVTIGATPGIAEPSKRMDRLLADEDLAERMRLQSIDEFLKAWQAMPIIRSQNRIPQAILGPMRDRRLRNDPRQLAGALLAVSSGQLPSLWDELDEIALPYLIVAGQQDQKFSQIAHLMAPQLPNAEISLLPKAGHCAHLEMPDDFLFVLRSIIRKWTQQ